MTGHKSRDHESTGVSVYKRDKQMNEIQQKIEENRTKMFEKRLALKKYDEYYYEYKTNIKLQIRALDEIIKHLNDVLKEQNLDEDLDLDSDDLVSINNRNKIQLKKDKTMILKEIDNLKKLLV